MDQIDNPGLQEPDHSIIEVDTERCNRCGICVDMCPMDVLRLSSQGYPFMRYRNDCWYCGCVRVCLSAPGTKYCRFTLSDSKIENYLAYRT